MNVGFTARHISPAILFGPVKGQLEPASLAYVKGSDAHFAIKLSDDQYVAVLEVLKKYGDAGNGTYDLNRRNCVHFTQDVAAVLGLAGTDQPRLMKKPRSFMEAVEAANTGRVTPINQHGSAYVATLAAVPGIDPALPVLAATGAPRPELAFSNAADAVPLAPGAVITPDSMSTGKNSANDDGPAKKAS